MKREKPLGVFCVDDNRFIAEALQRRLAFETWIRWDGWAQDAEEALRMIARERPDLVMLDIDMPGSDSFELVRRVADAAPGTKVVMFSGYVHADYIDRAIDVGAWGYLSKNQTMEEIMDSLRRIAGGEFVITPEADAGPPPAGPPPTPPTPPTE